MITLTYDDVLTRIRAVVEANPDYIYPPSREYGADAHCVYFDPDGAPSCIVGVALHDVLTQVGVNPDSRMNGADVWDLATEFQAHGVYEFTEKALSFLSTVQDYQDTASPWGEALAAGVQYVEFNDVKDVI